MSAIYLIILSLSVQIMFFTNHALKFKYQPSCLKVKILYNEDISYLYQTPSVVRTMQLQNFGWESGGLEAEEGNGRQTLKCILKDMS
jgi:hypothetical protein